MGNTGPESTCRERRQAEAERAPPGGSCSLRGTGVNPQGRNRRPGRERQDDALQRDHAVATRRGYSDKPHVGMADDSEPRLLRGRHGEVDAGDPRRHPRSRRARHRRSDARQPPPRRRTARGHRWVLVGADPAADLQSLVLGCSSPTTTMSASASRPFGARRSRAIRSSETRWPSSSAYSRTSRRSARSRIPSQRFPLELEPLTAKPLIAIENGPDGIDCEARAELAELPDDEAAAYRDGPAALEEVVARLRDVLGLITFFTANETEARAWTSARARPRSTPPQPSIRTSRTASCGARSSPNELVESGSRAEAARRGVQRLEGRATLSRTATSCRSASRRRAPRRIPRDHGRLSVGWTHRTNG